MSSSQMVSVPRDEIELTVHCLRMAGETISADELQVYLDQPAKHQDEPVALVDSPRCGASWPQFESVCGKTKDGKSAWQCGECARKEAAALRVEMEKYFGLYKEADTHAMHWQQQERVKARWAKQVEGERDTLRAQLAERDARIITAERLLGFVRYREGVVRQDTWEKIEAFLAASAEPEVKS